MANEEQLRFLKECIEASYKGKQVWNEWRKENWEVEVDLSGADLSGADLSLVKLSWTNLSRAELTEANLCRAEFIEADLSGANLSRAELTEANLCLANLYAAELSEANFEGAKVGLTDFGDVDLSNVKGLRTVIHEFPSTIGINTIERSRGNIPIEFLRGCGVSEEVISALRSVFAQPIQYFTCFISYSHQDMEFVDRLYSDLQNKGIRCWLDREDIKIGDRWKEKIEEAIRFYDKLLLILSSSSVESDWVEKEVEAALEKEHKRKKDVLFPIRLDQAVLESEKAWAGIVRRSRHIGDFSRWKEYDAYQKSFTRLLRDLKN